MTHTPRVLARLDGTLSAPAEGAAADVALRYVRANLAALGLSRSATSTRCGRPRPTTVDGITTVRWRQAVDGIAAADSELRVNLDGDGRVLNVLGSPALQGLDADTSPSLTAGEAVRVVQDNAGVYRSLPRKSGARSVTYADGTTAELALYTAGSRGAPTWRGRDAVYDMMVDAATGKRSGAANLVKSAIRARVGHHPGDGAGCGPAVDTAAR